MEPEPLSFGVSWFLALVLVASWNCYCSLRTFSDPALVFFVISLVSCYLQICWTQDAPLTQNQFPCKANCDQIQLRQPCGALMLKITICLGHVTSVSSGQNIFDFSCNNLAALVVSQWQSAAFTAKTRPT